MFARIFTALSLTALLSVPVFAQGSFRATIPFDFVAATTRLEAGDYELKVVNPTVLQITPLNGKTGCFVLTLAGGGGELAVENKLVFRKYGNAHFLSEMRRAGYSLTSKVPKSRIELEWAKRETGIHVASVPLRRP